MGKRDRLRRIEAGLARMEAAAMEAGHQHASVLEVIEQVIVAELCAAAALSIAVPAAGMTSGHAASKAARGLAELKQASGESGEAWQARVSRIFASARVLRGFPERNRPAAAAFIELALLQVASAARAEASRPAPRLSQER